MRFLLPIPLLLALLGAGCATPTPEERAQKFVMKAEAAERLENSRVVEQRRMMKVQDGDAGSERGAEIMVLDKYKSYDPSRNAVGGRTYDAGKARTKDFYFDQKANPGTYGTRDFYGSKEARTGDTKFATKDANTRSKSAIPNVDKTADSKTATTKEAWDAGRTAATKGLHDGRREYLGPESKKLRQSIDPVTMGDWRNGGESVVNTGSSVEKYSTLKPLSIQDIRELLNKNK